MWTFYTAFYSEVHDVHLLMSLSIYIAFKNMVCTMQYAVSDPPVL